jgi:hypothetical protein
MFLAGIGVSTAAVTAMDASVTFKFDGMELFCTGESERVTVALLDAMHHSPQLNITKIDKGQRSLVATLTGDELRGSLIIDVEGTAHPVTFHKGQARAGDSQDWRWVMHLEEIFPGRKLTVREERLYGKVHFLAGTFHATKLSQKPARFFSADGKGKALAFKRRVAEPAARIDLNPGEALLVRTDRDLLRFEIKEDVRYEVSLTNLPPPEKASFDHFLHYFDVIEQKLPRYVPFLLEQSAFEPPPGLCAPIYSSSSRTRFP